MWSGRAAYSVFIACIVSVREKHGAAMTISRCIRAGFSHFVQTIFFDDARRHSCNHNVVWYVTRYGAVCPNHYVRTYCNFSNHDCIRSENYIVAKCRVSGPNTIATACYALAYKKVASGRCMSSNNKCAVMGNEKPWANVCAFRNIGTCEKLSSPFDYMAHWCK